MRLNMCLGVSIPLVWRVNVMSGKELVHLVNIRGECSATRVFIKLHLPMTRTRSCLVLTKEIPYV